MNSNRGGDKMNLKYTHEKIEKDKAISAREILRREYGTSKNFMTPEIIKTGKINRKTAYEISKGTGFKNEPVFGLTIVEIINGETKGREDLSDCFWNIKEVNERITRLKNNCDLTG